jgi:small GTP-binding protein
MAGLDEQIEELEKLISTTKYNKRTQHAIGLYKARLAVLKGKSEAKSAAGKRGHGFSVRKTGDASVVLLGFPSVGKSSLLNALTNAESDVAHYAFTTLDCIPGMLEHRGAKIQLLDVPGIVGGAAEGTGRGKEVLQIVRNADLVIVLLDVIHPGQLQVIQQELESIYVRLNKKRPDVRITKQPRGGIRVGKTVKLPQLNDDTIKAILREFKITNADVLIRTRINADELIDVIEANRSYMPGLTVLNKMDLVDAKTLKLMSTQVKVDIAISAKEGTNIDTLKELIFSRLEFMPVFCKQAGKRADLNEPLILKQGATVGDMCRALHNDFVDRFSYARVWGKSARFEGQKLGSSHRLHENDVVELHLD